ncbi:MAG TPA: sugar ABC transporter permease [Spirochaetia bacterium]|nr:sugar ABC transporter permease [Spirochaetia bacterium]
MIGLTALWAIVAIVGVPLVLIGYLFLVERGLLTVKIERRNRIRPWLWLLPPFLLLAAFLIYPVINTIVLSLMNANSTKFVWFKNYAYIFTENSMLIVLRNNLLWLVFFTLIAVTLGLLIAVLTDRVRYESAAKALIFLPMAVSFVAAGVIWRFMYQFQPKGQPQVGTVNAILSIFPNFQPQAWLTNTSENNWALIIVGIWMWTGFAMVILSAGLKGIPESLLEAARMDGANEFQIFFKVTIPLLWSTITVVTTTLLINALKTFDIVYVMTNGNLGTDIIANRMYKEMFNFQNFGRASALAVILLVAIVPVMVLNIKRFGQQGGK